MTTGRRCLRPVCTAGCLEMADTVRLGTGPHTKGATCPSTLQDVLLYCALFATLCLKKCLPLVLQGEMAATAVNAPMMPPEVLKELQPFVSLAAGLGRAAVQVRCRIFSKLKRFEDFCKKLISICQF